MPQRKVRTQFIYLGVQKYVRFKINSVRSIPNVYHSCFLLVCNITCFSLWNNNKFLTPRQTCLVLTLKCLVDFKSSLHYLIISHNWFRAIVCFYEVPTSNPTYFRAIILSIHSPNVHKQCSCSLPNLLSMLHPKDFGRLLSMCTSVIKKALLASSALVCLALSPYNKLESSSPSLYMVMLLHVLQCGCFCSLHEWDTYIDTAHFCKHACTTKYFKLFIFKIRQA